VVSPDGRTLATGLTTMTGERPQNEGLTWLWNARTGQRIRSLTEAGGPGVFSPDGTVLATAGGYGDSLITVWNPATGRKIHLLNDQQEVVVEQLAFSPDGKLLAATESDGVTQLWSMTDPAKRPRPLGGELASVLTCVTFTPDGKTIVTGDQGDKVWLWNRLSTRHFATLTGTGNADITSVTVSADDRFVAAGDQNGQVFVWNLATRKRTAVMTDPGSYGVDAVAFSPDGRQLATGDSNGKTFLWSLPAGKPASAKPLATLVNPSGQVTSLLTGEDRTAVASIAFSADGKTLATSDTNGSAYLWRIR
jgi:WD40 repeat protein